MTEGRKNVNTLTTQPSHSYQPQTCDHYTVRTPQKCGACRKPSTHYQECAIVPINLLITSNQDLPIHQIQDQLAPIRLTLEVLERHNHTKPNFWWLHALHICLPPNMYIELPDFLYATFLWIYLLQFRIKSYILTLTMVTTFNYQLARIQPDL